MATIPLTTKTPEQIDADFEAEFKGVMPEVKDRPPTLAESLAPYRNAVMKQRVRGLTWKQIAAIMARPRIDVKVSGKALQKALGTKPRKTAKTRAPAPAPAPRLIIDPVTGQPTTVAPPPPPMTPKEHEVFDPLFQGLIPPIVKAKMGRKDARFYANSAVEMMRSKDQERFHALFASELDTLNETNCSRYGIPPEQIVPWRRKW